jgi:hypothetical protein
MPLDLILSGVCGQFVTEEQYAQLMFILGQYPLNDPRRSCKDVLTLFNEFPTHTVDNFKAMMDQLQLPYVYDDNKSLPENRRNFKDFFSCLTKIRCAVVEGGHRCEAACRILQGYRLGDPVPLEQSDIQVPENSTLFQLQQTVVYYSPNDNLPLDSTVLEYLKAISKQIAEQKNLVVPITWHNFFTRVTGDISRAFKGNKLLYENPAEFFQEHTIYRQALKNTDLRSNKIKQVLHSILTYAIFHYYPCRKLFEEADEVNKPKHEVWSKTDNKWVTLSAEHISAVSNYTVLLCFIL